MCGEVKRHWSPIDVVFTNATSILLADAATPSLSGRLTVTIVDESNAAIPFADVPTLGVTARSGKYGAAIRGTGSRWWRSPRCRTP